jgi:hypothetical protein
MALTKATNRMIKDAPVSVRDYGAVGDGVTDDTTAIQTAINSAKSVFFPAGTYRVTSTIIVGTQRALKGEYLQGIWTLGGASVIYGSYDDIGDGNPIMRAATTGSTQAISVENLTFRSANDVSSADLSAATSAGLVGFDVRGIKQGTQFVGCSFRSLTNAVAAIGDAADGNYEDKVTFDKCFFTSCYKAVDVNPTAGLHFVNCWFDECYDWIDCTGQVALVNTRFNQSSYASELVQIKGSVINADSVYIEGGNNWFAPTKSVSIRGSYFSEAFSASGSTKFSVKPQNDNTFVSIEGTRIGTNTRVINTAGTNISVRFVGLYNGSNFGQGSDISTALQNGMKFEGWGNEQSAWNIVATGSPVLGGQPREEGDALTKRAGNLTRGIDWTTSIDLSLYCIEDVEDHYIPMEYVRFVNIGTNNGTGGTYAYYAEIKIYKGYGSTWDYDISGPDAADYAVALSNKTSSGCDVTISETHSGSSDILWIDSASANMQITL